MTRKTRPSKSERFIIKKLKNNIVNGINFNADETSWDCELCHITCKIYQIPHKNSTSRAKKSWYWSIQTSVVQ